MLAQGRFPETNRWNPRASKAVTGNGTEEVGVSMGEVFVGTPECEASTVTYRTRYDGNCRKRAFQRSMWMWKLVQQAMTAVFSNFFITTTTSIVIVVATDTGAKTAPRCRGFSRCTRETLVQLHLGFSALILKWRRVRLLPIGRSTGCWRDIFKVGVTSGWGSSTRSDELSLRKSEDKGRTIVLGQYTLTCHHSILTVSHTLNTT